MRSNVLLQVAVLMESLVTVFTAILWTVVVNSHVLIESRHKLVANNAKIFVVFICDCNLIICFTFSFVLECPGRFLFTN